MANCMARRRQVPWLYPVMFSGILLAACSGDSSSIDPPGNGSPTDPGGITDPVVPNPPDDEPGAATDTTIGLAWAPSPDTVSGYIIYYGPTAQAADNRAVQLSIAAFDDPDAPNYSFNAGTDLGLSHGETVCFRLSAYKGADESALSEAACATL